MAVTDLFAPAHSDLERLAAVVDELATECAELPAGSSLAEQLRFANDAEVVLVLSRLGAVRRQVDALLTAVAAVVDRRSRPERGAAGLARQLGNRSGADLIAEVAQVPPAEASALVRVGAATHGELSLAGEELPPQCPAVAAAVDAGELGLTYANEIVRFRERVAPHAVPSAAEAAEANLVQLAVTERFRLREFQRAIARTEAYVDPDGAVPNLAAQRERRALTLRTLPGNGMLELRALLDVESGAFVREAIDSYTTRALRTSRGMNAPAGCGAGTVMFRPAESAESGESGDVAAGGAGVVVEFRSIPQIQADALVECCKHLLGCDLSKLPGPSSKVVFRMHVADLEPAAEDAATRVGEIDGGGVLPVEAVRRRAAAAGVIPLVLGGASEVLDLGRERRHFTPAQRLALVERDGGCAMCGLPPGMCEAHHLRWWSRDGGGTDLENGVLLCTRCHHLVHEGWELRVREGTVWFTPPARVDPQRRPRLGGRKRFDPNYAAGA